MGKSGFVMPLSRCCASNNTTENYKALNTTREYSLKAALFVNTQELESRHFLTIGRKKNKHVLLTSSVSLTRKICSLRSWRSLNVDCAVIEYTSANPCPFFMYRSLMAVNCSCKQIFFKVISWWMQLMNSSKGILSLYWRQEYSATQHGFTYLPCTETHWSVEIE